MMKLVKLNCSDITFNTEGMLINVQSSKTDQYQEGASLVITRTGLVTCLVSMTERYFRMGKLDHSSPGLVFR